MLFRRFSHKLTYSYAERNALLKRSNYPLMPVSKNRLDIPKILSQYSHIEHTPLPQTQDIFESYGRIIGLRRSGKNLTFIDLAYNNAKIQVVVNFKKLEATNPDLDSENIKLLRKGDAIAVQGKPWRTKAGELSILASQVPQLLSACLHPPPSSEIGEAVKRYNRVAELKAFDEARLVLEARDVIVSAVTEFLKQREFTQVQTPILSSNKGGASAEPFVTKSGQFLRVAPELWLKRLIIGGFERVFEIGPSFRNEGIDATHNPEFTTCEFYQSFTTLEELVELTKELLEFVVHKVSQKFPSLNHSSLLEWRSVDFFSEIENLSGKKLPFELTTESLVKYCDSVGVSVEKDSNVEQLLDRLAGHFIEPTCTKPTFIMNPPAILAPLAKHTTLHINGTDRVISRRFELIIGGREYINAYEEENDPVSQLESLEIQANDENSITVSDMDYVRDMEWGLPPTAGWGMGIDRLVMLLTNSTRINQVLSFGGIKQVNQEGKEKESADTQ